MFVGIPVDLASMNSVAGSIVLDVRNSLRRAANYNAWLQDTAIWPNDAPLIAVGYDQTAVNLLRASFIDLNNLNRVATGLQATGASDFFANAKKLTGAVV